MHRIKIKRKRSRLSCGHYDLHKNNSFAVRISFTEKGIWYKPKSFTNEIWFYNLIRDINTELDYTIKYWFPRYLNRTDYSFIEHIPHKINNEAIDEYSIGYESYLERA
ncbi:DUF4135 domain-containing protein [Sphingobacterium sp. UBA5670]|uniref:DUF4135 domain-containing protein n=1 Tax=Sphingobacterium sp. UBA5670 TaxID=1947502 RepID=UPI0039C900D2